MPEQYEIVIRNETNKSSTPVATNGTVIGGSTVAEPIQKTTTSSDGSNKNALVSALVATSAIKPYIQQAVSFRISQIEMQTGSAELQRQMAARYSMLSSAGGILSAGLTGGIPGAAIAAAMMVAQTGIETGVNYVEIKNKKTLEEENLQLRRSRAGMVAGKSRGGGVV